MKKMVESFAAFFRAAKFALLFYGVYSIATDGSSRFQRRDIEVSNDVNKTSSRAGIVVSCTNFTNRLKLD